MMADVPQVLGQHIRGAKFPFSITTSLCDLVRRGALGVRELHWERVEVWGRKESHAGARHGGRDGEVESKGVGPTQGLSHHVTDFKRN